MTDADAPGMLHELVRLETMPALERLDHQLDAVSTLLAGMATSHHHASRLGPGLPTDQSLGGIDELAEKVSSISKSDILNAQLPGQAFRSLLCGPDELRRVYSYPSGQVMGWTAYDMAAQEASYAWALRTAGVTPADIVDLTFQFAWVAAGTVWDAGARALGCAVLPGGAGESARHAAVLDDVPVTSLVGFPSFLTRVGEAASSPGNERIRTLVVAGERMTVDDRAHLALLFPNAAVREVYGTAEVALAAAECGIEDAGMHTHPMTVVEVRDPDTGLLVTNGSGGELILTSALLRDDPIVRFRTGDITAFVATEPCDCGRTTPRVGPIVGRIGDTVRMKGLFLSQAQVVGCLNSVGWQDRPFHLSVSREGAVDRGVLHIEAADSEVTATAETLRPVLRAKLGMTLDLRPAATGSLTAHSTWFTDHRQSGITRTRG